MTRYDLINRLPIYTTGFEIGVCEGEFSKQILNTPIKHLVLVDPWQHIGSGYDDPANVDQGGQDERFKRILQYFFDDTRVSIMRTFSRSDIVRSCIATYKPDWVFIDANHSFEEAYNDLLFYSQFVHRIFCHDYVDNELSRSMNFGVKKAVDTFLENNNLWSPISITDEEWPTIELVSNA